MRLFRNNIGLGAWLALISLTLNIALSFGHVHAIGGNQRYEHVSAVTLSHGSQTGHHDDGLANDLCPVCMASLALAKAMAPTPPALPHPIASVLVDPATEPVLAFELPRAGFQSRAPPIS
jgi:hypothetical protein